jgi:hypothetical protein
VYYLASHQESENQLEVDFWFEKKPEQNDFIPPEPEKIKEEDSGSLFQQPVEVAKADFQYFL